MTTFTGFVLPSDFDRMSEIPADSTTARTEPPAMTPVPFDAGLLRPLAERGPHGLRALGLLVLAVTRVEAGRGGEGLPRDVVDQLRVDVRDRAVHGKPWTRGAALHLRTHAGVTANAARLATLHSHVVPSLGLRADLAGLACLALDALFRVLDALRLVRV